MPGAVSVRSHSARRGGFMQILLGAGEVLALSGGLARFGRHQTFFGGAFEGVVDAAEGGLAAVQLFTCVE